MSLEHLKHFSEIQLIFVISLYLVPTPRFAYCADIPGAEHCITSDGFFQLDYLPSRVAVIGGGYIGVELAGKGN